MRVVASIALVAGAACGFTPGKLLGGDDGGDGDGGAGGDGHGSDDAIACDGWAIAPSGIDACASPQPIDMLELCTPAEFTLSTDDGDLVGLADPASELLTTTTPNIRVVAVTSLKVCSGARLHITGSHPIAFVVHGRADIEGTIDVSAWFDSAQWQPGPGAETACSAGIGPMGITSNDGSGGGGGGGFGTAGGAGGPGDVVGGVAGGMAEGSTMPLRGGCRGGPGGDGDSTGGGFAGRGGGAIQIAARDLIINTGTIRASGGPGMGGRVANAGGGGGGAGGAILLEAPDVSSTGAVCANGGGGGGGSSDGGGFNPGGPGSVGTCALSAALGGAAGSGGGSAGGKGGFGTTAPETGKSGSEGGGGGGGAVGRIHVRSQGTPTLSANTTPPATTSN